MRNSRIHLILIVVLSLLFGGERALAQAPPAATSTELKVFLVTMGPGDEIWERFGHNALWIHDPQRGSDLVYNYGAFDFDSPGYWGRFVKGDWIYQLAVADIYQILRAYQYYDRTVTAQELNLTPAQALELQQFLEWNARAENAEYLYDYYRDNCSTRVRDVLDQILGGTLYQATAEVPTGTTFRSHSLRLVQGDLVTYTGLALGLGPAADRPISRWEEMFLPLQLQEQVREQQIMDADGRSVPLMRYEQVLYQATDRPAQAAAATAVLSRYLLAGVIVGLLLLGLAWLAVGQGARGTAGRFGFAAVTALWSLATGIVGLLLTVLWVFTNHAISYRNGNLLQANPLALALIVLLPALVFGARWARRPTIWLTTTIAAGSLLGLILHLLPWFDQVNGEIIALLLPPNLALAWAAYRIRRSLSSPPVETSSGPRVSHRSASAGL